LQSEPWSGGVTDLYVLDTSSIFTFTDQEDGADEVERLLNAAKQLACPQDVPLERYPLMLATTSTVTDPIRNGA
jgi:hypothetical protein